MTNRYQVEGKDMDGVTGYYVVDTQNELYQLYKNTNVVSSCYTTGLSMSKVEMINLAIKMNKE
jgi:hypothetical protein|tara:strand:- start:108 stop:296 length:189 start_codon:yes stop_codon:yes gene_type:complete